MKRLLLISALLLVASNGWAQVSDEVHQRCKDVADYVGCVQISTGSVPTKDNSSEADLKKALRILPRRLENTSLRDFSSAIQPFTDALALAEGDETLRYSQLLLDAKRVEVALDAARAAWDWSITASVKYMGNKNCPSLNALLEPFNGALGGMAVSYVSTDKFCSTTARKEGEMLGAISRIALTIADGDVINLPPFKTVSQVKEENEARERKAKQNLASKVRAKDKPTLSLRQARKLFVKAVKIMNSDKTDKQEAKELLTEVLTSNHNKAFGAVGLNGDYEFFTKNNARYYLAVLLINEKDYDGAEEHLKTIIESDEVNCGVCTVKESIRRIFLDTQLNAVNLLEQLVAAKASGEIES